MEAVKRGPGRPPGSRNKKPLQEYPDADVDTLVARQLAMLEMTQQTVLAEIQAARAAGQTLGLKHIEALEKLSYALLRAIDALKKSTELADELSSRLTAEQLLEAAIKKLEGQDRPTIRYAVKRLRAKLESLEAAEVPVTDAAADAIAALIE